MDYLTDNIEVIEWGALFIIIGIILIILGSVYLERKKETDENIAALPEGITEGYLYWFKIDGKRVLYKIINGKRCFWDPIAYMVTNKDQTVAPASLVELPDNQIATFMTIPEGAAVDITGVLDVLVPGEKELIEFIINGDTIIAR